MNEILLRTQGERPALALMSERKLVEYWPLDEDLAFEAQAIYVGRVGRVMKSLKAVFVSLAPGVEGFLPFDEMLAIKPLPASGDSLLVQIKKPAQGGKAAYLTQDISLPGRYAMLLPYGSYAHASKRVKDKQAMKLLARRLCPEGMGLVLRAKAERVQKREIEKEIEGLIALWRQLELDAKPLSAPALVREAPGPIERLIRDEQLEIDQLITDDERAIKGLSLRHQVHPDPFGLYSVEQQLYQALKRRVYLPSGGQLVLDPCEAALLVDVNTGKDISKAGDLILRTNLEAAREIARLLRLRRVGGIILIDFIDMDSQAQREQVQACLEEALSRDRITSQVLGFTRLGLMEMTRRKAETRLPAQGLGIQDGVIIEEETDHSNA